MGKSEVVVVKVCKPNQDLRFDVPAVGLQTIETMKEKPSEEKIKKTAKENHKLKVAK